MARFLQSGTRGETETTKPEYKKNIPHCKDLTLLSLDADPGIFNFVKCDSNSEAIQVYNEHFEPEEPEDLIWHGLFCTSRSFTDGWLIVGNVRNESGWKTEWQWFHQWKGNVS